jgi:hypothetical protein
VRQILESSRSLEVKYKGNLNTVSGEYQYRGHVKKLFYSNTPSLARWGRWRRAAARLLLQQGPARVM